MQEKLKKQVCNYTIIWTNHFLLTLLYIYYIKLPIQINALMVWNKLYAADPIIFVFNNSISSYLPNLEFIRSMHSVLNSDMYIQQLKV